MRLDLSRLTDCLAYIFAAGENEIAYVAWKACNPYSVIVDVGANVGTTTLLFAKVASHGLVHSFEPSRAIREALEVNIHINGLSNVRVYPFGLGERATCGRLELAMTGNPGSAYFVEDSETPEVEIKTLDDVLNQEECIDFIKIDVEGFEHSVLKGAMNLIRQWRPTIVLEVNSVGLGRAQNSFSSIVDLLSPMGYEFFFVQRGVFLPYRYKSNYGIHNVIASHANGSWHPYLSSK